MPRRSFTAVACLLVCLGALVALPGRDVGGAARFADTLPSTLTDREFWSLVEELSEPNGVFVSRSGSPDNLLSNEMQVSTVAAQLAGQVPPAGVYLGVGPEQNFSYIAAVKPRIAFITDIRRGNLDVHLLYKALFEMSSTRADFIGRLFGRKRPASMPRTATAAQIMAAAGDAPPVAEAAFAGYLIATIDLLAGTHHFALTADDRAAIEHAYRAYFRFGPAINYTSSINGRSWRFATYADLMASVDARSGTERTFLANDEYFTAVKAMESRNLIVPVVGNFAGAKALRAIGTWLKARGANVNVFYVSNVEQYLQESGVWPAFCANVAALPLTPSSIFVRPNRGGSSFSPMATETAACAGK
jgi:hypothetical protein